MVIADNLGYPKVFHECVTRSQYRDCDNSVTAKIFHPLLALIASATDSELAKYVEYMKEENRILRARLPKQVHTRKGERERLLKLGKLLGRAIEELITIVTPATFYRWMREEKDDSTTENPKGGRRKPREIRELVIEIARTTGFGYTRIIGELRKLGIRKISRQTVRRILKEDRPNRDCQTFVTDKMDAWILRVGNDESYLVRPELNSLHKLGVFKVTHDAEGVLIRHAIGCPFSHAVCDFSLSKKPLL